MDILSWTNLNPTVKIKNTVKLYFNQYLYKVKLYCPAAGVVRYNSGLMTRQDIEEKVEMRLKILGEFKKYNWGGSWFSISDKSYTELKTRTCIDDLLILQTIKPKDKIKILITEPFVNVYSNSEQMLWDTCHNFSSNRILELSKPKDCKSEEILNQGKFINHLAEKYMYQVRLLSYRFDNLESKHKLVTVLENLDADVKYSLRLKNSILSKNYYFLGGNIYVKNDSTVFFIKLNFPHLVGKIYPLSCDDT